MAGKTSKKSAKDAKKAAAKRVATKAAKPRKAVAKSSARKPTKAAAKELPAQYAVPKATATKSKGPAVAAKPTLLAGGNPQIAKADGDTPVQAYIAAMPGWKSDVGRRLDALIVRTVPGVRKAVKWNSPFYGVEGQGWFLDFHTFTNYVKVAFFRGTSLRPVPLGESKHEEVRYLDIHEDDELDEAQLATWIRQAAALPGWVLASDPRLLSTKVHGTGQHAVNSRGRPMPRKDGSRAPDSASQMIDQRIRELGDRRGSVLKRMRELIHEADPEVVEEWKWRKESSPGTPVWSHNGGICTGESYKQVVKMTFFHGASLKDPAHLFNSSLEGNTRRAIDIHQDDAIEEAAFKELIRAAVAFNVAKRKK
jgi:hypothetical protein